MVAESGRRCPGIIYIGGYGRSGSTLLDILLGIHPNVESAGELVEFLTEMKVQGSHCSCGKSTASCQRWQSRFGRVAEVLRESGHTLEKSRSVQRRFESRLTLMQAALGVSVPVRDAGNYAAVQRALFNSVVNDQPHVRYVVDSSKTTSHRGGRPFVLQSVAGCSVYFIHLVRSPESVLGSLMTGLNRDLEKGVPRVRRYAVVKGLLGWVQANVVGLCMGRLLGQGRYLLIRYEDVISEAETTFTALARFLDLDFEPWQSVVRRNPVKRDWHIFAGNRMRHKDVTLQVQVAQGQVPLFYRFMCAALCLPLMRRFGYG